MKRGSRSGGKGFLFAVIVLFVAIFAGGALVAQRGLSQVWQQVGVGLDPDAPASSESKTIHFTVLEGQSTTEIAERLEASGLIRSALGFRLQARSQGVESRLVAGEYDLRPNMRPSEILVSLQQQGRESGISVTFPEGWRMEEMADRLSAVNLVARDDFLRAARDADVRYEFLNGRGAKHLEGYLFPDTYTFGRAATPATIVDTMLRVFDRRFDIALRQQAERVGFSIGQVVTLASIVEREAAVAEERPMIAEVFLNRLAQNMPLQADPTVQYAVARLDQLGAESGYWKRDLTIADLQFDSPYNTYARRGLPPGPICNPGLAAIKAVLSPTDTGYLYFVAKSDGSHAFARTLAEHNENVARYQGARRPR